MRETEDYMEGNFDGVRESQPYFDVQSAQFNNMKDFRADAFVEDQSEFSTYRPSQRVSPEMDTTEISNLTSTSAGTSSSATTATTTSSATATTASTAGASTAATAASASAATATAALSSAFVAAVVVTSVIVPTVADADVSVDFVKVIAGTDFVSYEIFIADYEGDNMRIVLMDGISEIYNIPGGNGEFRDTIEKLKPGNSYVLEVRTGMPAFHVVDSYEISTQSKEGPLKATASLSTIDFAFDSGSLLNGTEATFSVFADDGTSLFSTVLNGGQVSKKLTGLTPGKDFFFTLVQGEDTLWSETVSTYGPSNSPATLTINPGSQFMKYTVNVPGMTDDDLVKFELSIVDSTQGPTGGDSVTSPVGDLDVTSNVQTGYLKSDTGFELEPNTTYRATLTCYVANGPTADDLYPVNILSTDYQDVTTQDELDVDYGHGFFSLSYTLTAGGVGTYVPVDQLTVVVNGGASQNTDVSGTINGLTPKQEVTLAFYDGEEWIFETDPNNLPTAGYAEVTGSSEFYTDAVDYSASLIGYQTGDVVEAILYRLAYDYSQGSDPVEEYVATHTITQDYISNDRFEGLEPGEEYRLYLKINDTDLIFIDNTQTGDTLHYLRLSTTA